MLSSKNKKKSKENLLKTGKSLIDGSYLIMIRQ